MPLLPALEIARFMRERRPDRLVRTLYGISPVFVLPGLCWQVGRTDAQRDLFTSPFDGLLAHAHGVGAWVSGMASLEQSLDDGSGVFDRQAQGLLRHLEPRSRLERRFGTLLFFNGFNLANHAGLGLWRCLCLGAGGKDTCGIVGSQKSGSEFNPVAGAESYANAVGGRGNERRVFSVAVDHQAQGCALQPAGRNTLTTELLKDNAGCMPSGEAIHDPAREGRVHGRVVESGLHGIQPTLDSGLCDLLKGGPPSLAFWDPRPNLGGDGLPLSVGIGGDNHAGGVADGIFDPSTLFGCPGIPWLQFARSHCCDVDGRPVGHGRQIQEVARGGNDSAGETEASRILFYVFDFVRGFKNQQVHVSVST